MPVAREHILLADRRMPRKQRFAPKKPPVREATPMTEDTKPGDPPKENQPMREPHREPHDDERSE